MAKTMARWRRAGATTSLTAVVLLGSGCSENGAVSLDADAGAPDAGWDTVCGPNLKPHGPACVPTLDDCPDDHAPVPGGGCKRIGVVECEIDGVEGLRAPPDWACTRIGVKECTAADGRPGIRGPPGWTCTAIGAPAFPACPSGWVTAAKGGCEPLLPATPCPQGTMEVLGETTCQPIGPCGNKKWGHIPVTEETIFVDGSAPAENGDGSAEKPFSTIGQALAVAPKGGHVAVAAGTYTEHLVLDRPVVLQGRCAALVKIAAPSDTRSPAVLMTASKSVLRGVTVTGPRAGVVVTAPDGPNTVSEVAVVGCGRAGMGIFAGAKVTLSRALIARNVGAGLGVGGGEAVLEQVVVRDTQPDSQTQLFGRGIDVGPPPDEALPARITLHDCLISDNREIGLAVIGSQATLERTVIRRTKPVAADGQAGIGLVASRFQGLTTSLILRDGVVAENRTCGLLLAGAEATLERVVVRNTLAQQSDGLYGRGIETAPSPEDSAPSSLAVRDAVLAHSHNCGVAVGGSSATLDRVVVRDTEPDSQQVSGAGVVVFPAQGLPATLTLRQSTLRRNRLAGLQTAGAQATVERSVIRDTVPAPISGVQIGVGIQAIYLESAASELTLRDSLVANNTGAGLHAVGAKATVERTVIRDTRLDPSSDNQGHGIELASSPTDVAGSLSMHHALLQRNHSTGVLIEIDARATITHSVIRDTRPHPGDPSDGMGVMVGNPHNPQPAPPELVLEDSLVANNVGAGLATSGGRVQAERVVVRDTQACPDKQFGIGIQAVFHKVPAELTLGDSVIRSNLAAGVVLAGSHGTLERTVVRDTEPQLSDGLFGFGVGVWQENDSGSLTMTDCALTGNHTAGVQAIGTPATLVRTAVTEIRSDSRGIAGLGIYADPLGNPDARLLVQDSRLTGNTDTAIQSHMDTVVERSVLGDTVVTSTGEFGDGLVVGVGPNQDMRPTVTLRDSVVRGNSRAGLLFVDCGGKVQRCWIHRNNLAVVLDKGADPLIAPDNVVENNTEDRISMGQGLKTPPPLTLPPLP
jgi:hypothetical protein